MAYGELLDKMQQSAARPAPSGTSPGAATAGWFGFDPFSGGSGFTGLISQYQNMMTTPDGMLQIVQANPAMAALFDQGTANANAAANYAASVYNYAKQKDILGQQRAAAAEARAIEKKKLQFQLETALRDGDQARAEGLQGAINNALQRGIFRSGILEENKAEVNREADEYASDAKTQIELALEALTNQGVQQDLGYDMTIAGWDESMRTQKASAAQMTAAAKGGPTWDDLYAMANNDSLWGTPTAPATTSPTAPPASSPKTGVQGSYNPNNLNRGARL